MDIALILEYRFSNAQWALDGNNYDNLIWLDDSPKPTEEELRELWPSVDQEFLLRIAERKRAEAYREESDPLFFKYQRGESSREEWETAVEDIRQRFPYPEIDEN